MTLHLSLLSWIKMLPRMPLLRGIAAGIAAFAVLYLSIAWFPEWEGRGLIWPYLAGLNLKVAIVVPVFVAAGAYAGWATFRWQRAESQARVQQIISDTYRREAAHFRELAEKAEAKAEANAKAKAKTKAKAAPAAPPAPDEKFRAAKQCFARMFHPDNVRGGSLEKVIRAEVFKEYWGELDRIETSGRE